MWQEKSTAFFMKNVQELDDKLLERCKEVERLAVFRDTWDGYNGKAWRVQLRYIDWQGKKRQHTKRGFRSKKEAQEYERRQSWPPWCPEWTGGPDKVPAA